MSAVQKRGRSFVIGGWMNAAWIDDTDSDRWTVFVSGELDLESGPLLREHLAGVLARCPDSLVVDLTGCTFCDSSGLGALVATRRRAHLLDRKMVLRVQGSGRVDRLLDLSRLAEHFDVERVTS
jgi:anti-sigma B factor antagonist